LRGEAAVDFELLLASNFAFRQCRIIQEGKTDRALDLQRTRTREKYRGCMGINPSHRSLPCAAGLAKNAKTFSCMSKSGATELLIC